MLRVLLICTANICRSQLVQGLLKKQLADQGLDEEWEVSSAGSWAETRLSNEEIMPPFHLITRIKNGKVTFLCNREGLIEGYFNSFRISLIKVVTISG